MTMHYEHTQKAPMHYILYGVAAIMIVSAWLSVGDPITVIILSAGGCLLLILSLSFRSLTVSDEGERLSIRFGPIPLFRKSIAYADITRVEPGKSSIIDGWGIHYIPGRGWTYNLWGFGCAVVYLGKRVIRIGTDDVENLVAFLNRRIGAEHG
jgi:hypothetical protein